MKKACKRDENAKIVWNFEMRKIEKRKMLANCLSDEMLSKSDDHFMWIKWCVHNTLLDLR